MLGHAKASMTLEVYADLFDDDLDSVAVNLDAAIKSAADWLEILRAGRNRCQGGGAKGNRPRYKPMRVASVSWDEV